MKKAKIDWKGMTRKQKAEYIWDYYKIHILLGVLALAIAIYVGVDMATSRDPLMSIIMLDARVQAVETSPTYSEFLELNGYEVYDDAVRSNTAIRFWKTELYEQAYYENLQLQQAYHALIWSETYDLIMGGDAAFEDTANGGCFIDLSQYLPADLIEKHHDDFVYTDEEGTVDSYPCAIILDDNRWLQQNEIYLSCSAGVLKSAPNPKIALQFIEYLLTNEQ